MQKILVSACLVGEKCNYKGQGKYCPDIEKIKEKYELVLFCPECEGGLPTPRLPNEIQGSKVIRSDKVDVTKEFQTGAAKALMLCEYLGIRKAVLKEKSPSCGTHKIHDGSFSDKLIPGLGITARLLKSKGIEVYSEDEIEKLL